MSQVQALRLEIEDAKKYVALRDALTRLMKTRDWNKVFKQDYFMEEPARLVQLRATPQMSHPDKQEALLRDLDAIGCLHQYIHKVLVIGDRSEEAIKEHEAELAGIEAGEYEGDAE